MRRPEKHDSAPVNWIEGVITYVGRQDNLALCEATFFVVGANLLMALGAIISIVLTILKGKLEGDEQV